MRIKYEIGEILYMKDTLVKHTIVFEYNFTMYNHYVIERDGYSSRFNCGEIERMFYTEQEMRELKLKRILK